ncbi:MAG: glutamine--fructose-6-phosphate transaminase (isomerizing) [Eubacteriales bacterium]
MCGIVGYTGKREASPILLDGLAKLEYRGYDSAGIAIVNKNEISVCKSTGRIANLRSKADGGQALAGSTGIGHTRWATHGAPTDINAHPHLSNDGKFAVVHNGIIENYVALRDELISKGFVFKSETDTEVIVHLIDMYFDGDLKDAFLKTVARLHGSWALGVISNEDESRVFVARENSPLIIGIGEGENYFASDITALIHHTRNVIYLDDGDFAEITPESVSIFDKGGNALEKEIRRVSWDIHSAEKGGYEHFMLKEIMEQPRAVRETVMSRIEDGEIVFDGFDMSDEQLKKINKIMITACGSACYAGRAAKYAFEQLCSIPVEIEIASELRYSDPLIDEHTLLIVISQSGETADTIAAMKECKRRGAQTLAIVNVVGSTIANIADHVLYTWAGPEIAVATTKGYTTQLSLLYLLALHFGRKLGKVSSERYQELLEEIKNLPNLLHETLDMNSMLETLAEKYCNCRSMFFIGRNSDYAIALEGALKMKELSYIHAEAYPAGELKHGSIALIDDEQVVVALLCNEKIKDKTMSNVVEIKARGASVVALAFADDESVAKHADDVIRIPRADGLIAPLLEVIPLQLFAYYTANEKGCDIDKPKNLAKSVTVE